jgi:hypothetical protein
MSTNMDPIISCKLITHVKILVTSNVPGRVGEVECNYIYVCPLVEGSTKECCTSINIQTLQVKNVDGYKKKT